MYKLKAAPADPAGRRTDGDDLFARLCERSTLPTLGRRALAERCATGTGLELHFEGD
jgi:hypothetical protein